MLQGGQYLAGLHMGVVPQPEHGEQSVTVWIGHIVRMKAQRSV